MGRSPTDRVRIRLPPFSSAYDNRPALRAQKADDLFGVARRNPVFCWEAGTVGTVPLPFISITTAVKGVGRLSHAPCIVTTRSTFA